MLRHGNVSVPLQRENRWTMRVSRSNTQANLQDSETRECPWKIHRSNQQREFAVKYSQVIENSLQNRSEISCNWEFKWYRPKSRRHLLSCSMIVYDILCIFSQVAAYMNFAVQVFEWTACPCQRRPPLEPRASMYAKQPSPSRNESNTVQNESSKKDLIFGSYFRFVRHESKTSFREFDISTKDTLQHESSIKLYTLPSKNIFKSRPQGHSCTLKYSS